MRKVISSLLLVVLLAVSCTAALAEYTPSPMTSAEGARRALVSLELLTLKEAFAPITLPILTAAIEKAGGEIGTVTLSETEALSTSDVETVLENTTWSEEVDGVFLRAAFAQAFGDEPSVIYDTRHPWRAGEHYVVRVTQPTKFLNWRQYGVGKTMTDISQCQNFPAKWSTPYLLESMDVDGNVAQTIIFIPRAR